MQEKLFKMGHLTKQQLPTGLIWNMVLARVRFVAQFAWMTYFFIMQDFMYVRYNAICRRVLYYQFLTSLSNIWLIYLKCPVFMQESFQLRQLLYVLKQVFSLLFQPLHACKMRLASSQNLIYAIKFDPNFTAPNHFAPCK